MRKLIVIVDTSLDGFIANKNGELHNFSAGEEILEFICRLTKEANATLLGPHSFELLNGYWPSRNDDPYATWNEIVFSDWYNKADKYVASSTMKEREDITVLRDDLEEDVYKLKAKEGKNILVFGSPMLSQCLFKRKLVDEYWVFVNPVMLGQGISPFPKKESPTNLRLLEVKSFANGVVALHYAFSDKNVSRNLYFADRNAV